MQIKVHFKGEIDSFDSVACQAKMEQAARAVLQGRNLLITGPGGVGKSYMIGKLASRFDATLTAMTGMAAVLIGGKTLHSALGIGLGKDSAQTLARRCPKKIWLDLKLLIIDEVSMLSAELLDKIETVARLVRKNPAPFGGVRLILSGDFLQLPTIGGEFCFTARCWNELNLEHISLTKIKRQLDTEFQAVLNSARTGTLTPLQLDYLLRGGTSCGAAGIVPTRILCKNVDVDAINMSELQKLAANEVNVYKAEVNLETFPPAFRIQAYCNAAESLTLCVGAQVMLLVNRNQDRGLVNGSRGVVVAFDSQGLPTVRFACGAVETIDFHPWEVLEQKKLCGTIYAIPLKLAWAVTCHKVQGACLDSAVVNLNGVFEYGQAYVAISRVRSVECLVLKNASVAMFRAHPEALEFYKNLNTATVENGK